MLLNSRTQRSLVRIRNCLLFGLARTDSVRFGGTPHWANSFSIAGSMTLIYGFSACSLTLIPSRGMLIPAVSLSSSAMSLDRAHGHEIANRIEGQLRLSARVDRERRRDDQQHAAVRRGFRDELAADDAVHAEALPDLSIEMDSKNGLSSGFESRGGHIASVSGDEREQP